MVIILSYQQYIAEKMQNQADIVSKTSFRYANAKNGGKAAFGNFFRIRIGRSRFFRFFCSIRELFIFRGLKNNLIVLYYILSNNTL